MFEGSQPTQMLVIQQVFLLWFQTCQTNFVIAEMPHGRLQTIQHMSSLDHLTDAMEQAQAHKPCDWTVLEPQRPHCSSGKCSQGSSRWFRNRINIWMTESISCESQCDGDSGCSVNWIMSGRVLDSQGFQRVASSMVKVDKTSTQKKRTR